MINKSIQEEIDKHIAKLTIDNYYHCGRYHPNSRIENILSIINRDIFITLMGKYEKS